MKRPIALSIEIEPRPAITAKPALVVQEGDQVAVDTGVAKFEVSACNPFLLAFDFTNGIKHRDPIRCRLTAEDASRTAYGPHIERLRVEDTGPLRASVSLSGKMITKEGLGLLDLFARLEFFAGLPIVQADITLRNSRRAQHPGGVWELGDPASVFLRHASLELGLPSSQEPAEFLCSPEPRQPLTKFALPFELYQDSSGGENWRSPNHVNRRGTVPLAFRGYRISADGEEVTTGLRAKPIAKLQRGENRVAVGFRLFWEEFPKALEATSDRLTIRLFPPQSQDSHELQGGEQKTHRFYLTFGEDSITEEPLAWCRAPTCPTVRPDWTFSTGSVPYLMPGSSDPNEGHLRLVRLALDAEDGFEHKRETVDEFGWRHFGDLYADHENAYYDGPKPLISHYNNQYDAVAGLIYQFLRSGEPRWWKLADELASHVVDIDIYHTDLDKAAYNHGLFWHTYHYIDAGKSTHRSYPRSSDSPGGGPSSEHNYSTGLMLHYFLTGSLLSRQAVLGLADWVIAMDDGRKTAFRWLSRTRTGLASASGSRDYHGPGRAPANSINALLDAHRLTGRAIYLDKAEQLIRRCIHPADDLKARDLLDAERRWYYTIFLQVLGKYLDCQVERGELGFMYSYARASLLHYADWMVENEYPYLEKPEILEYPTETWAAQDMRKSEVFKFAAKNSAGDQQRRFLQRARFFFDSSISQLTRMPTHTLCRPTVLMLSLGHSQGYFDAFSVPKAPPVETYDFGEPTTFVPQIEQAKKNLIRAGLIGAVLLAVAGVIGVVL